MESKKEITATDRSVWFKKHAKQLKKYVGKYITVVDEKIVASSLDAGEAIILARKKFPKKTSLLIYVPKKNELELLI